MINRLKNNIFRQKDHDLAGCLSGLGADASLSGDLNIWLFSYVSILWVNAVSLSHCNLPQTLNELVAAGQIFTAL